MANWNPKDEMGWLNYLRFKMGMWVEVSTLPNWVQNASKSYYKGFKKKHGHRPYDVEKVFTGDNLEYKIFFKAVSQGEIRPVYYARVK